MRITLNVADVSRFHPMLSDQPELVSDAPISDWRASWLTRLPPRGFQQRISRQWQTYRKRELDGRVQQVFLERVNDPMLHCLENHRDLSRFWCVAKKLLSHRLAGCLITKL